MTLAQLTYFIAVVEEGSFTRGAKRVHVTQSSLSQQIRQLESELGGVLIERLPRRVRLTQAGKAFLPEARATVNAAQRARRDVRAVLRLDEGELEIATLHSIASGILLDSISRWHEIHPTIPIRLHEFDNREVLEDACRAGVGDIAFGPPPSGWNGPVQSIGWEQFVVVLPTADPILLKAAPVSLDRLAHRHWVLFPARHGFAAIVQQVCLAAGFEPTAAVHTTQNDAAARYAAAGIGPTLIPENIVPSDLRACARRVDPPVTRELTAYARAPWQPHVRAYLDIVETSPIGHLSAGAMVVD